MNTILSQNRSLNLFIVIGLAAALIAAIVLASPAAVDVPAISQNAAEDANQVAAVTLSADEFPAYRESEWHSVLVPETGVNGQDVYRQSERTLIPAQAGLMAYHLSERTLVDPLAEYLASERTLSPIMTADFSSYHLSEWTMVPVQVDFSSYLESERTLLEAPDGMTIYLTSERTGIPVRFTPYQLSEWFGK
jgi:hypothetical protein